MNTIKKYFPELTAQQLNKFELLFSLYAQWNEKINVISRKDMDNFFERHVLHSLAIAKINSFEKKEQLVLENEGNIVWVIGKRLDDRFKVTPNTKKVLKLCLK